MVMKSSEAILYLGKVPTDEPVFVLRGQDILASYLVKKWAGMLEDMNGSPAKIAEARICASEMKRWEPRKIPD